jgi:hypothetical protein
MKKSLLIVVAALFVALGANAQAKRVVNATKVTAPMTTLTEVAKVPAAEKAIVATAHKKAAPRKAIDDIVGDYILEFQNFDGDFTASSSFEIVAASGTTMVVDVETDEETIDFEYNVQLNDFTYASAVAYGYYDEAEGTILIPVQTIATNSTYGRIVLSGVSSDADGPAHLGFDLLLDVDADGSISLDGEEEAFADAGMPGEYMSGWYSYLPDYADGGAWNFGFEIEFYAPNGYVHTQECHIKSGGWSPWEYGYHWCAIEDYGTELVVHNFLDLAPITITVDGYNYRVPIPQQMDDYNLGDEDNPDYYHIWSMDADGNPRESGTIDGVAFVDDDGYQGIRFYSVEWSDAWTDDDGEHEAGYYNTVHPQDYFMVSSTYQPGQGAYWQGEYRFLTIWVSGDIELNIEPTGIKNIQNVSENTNAQMYDLQGRAVDANFKGVVIKNGKKVVVK